MSDSILKFRADAKAIAKMAALCADVTKNAKRWAPRALNAILLETDGDRIAMMATDLDVALRLSEACTTESPGRAMVDAAALADALKSMAKAKGAECEMEASEDGSTLFLISGRARIRLSTLCGDDFPDGIIAWEAAETKTALAKDIANVTAHGFYEGDRDRELSASAKKLLGKVLKRIGADTEAAIERNAADAETALVRLVVEGCTFTAGLHAPDLYKAERRSLYFYGRDWSASREAETYLHNLASSLSLARIGEHAGELVEYEGRAVGMTFGEHRRDYNENRPMPDDWVPPATAEIIVYGCLEECTVDDRKYARLTGRQWIWQYFAERPGEIIYDDGAYSLPMPAAQRHPLSILTVDIDGEAIPLKCKFSGSCTAEIELSAEQVREMCGPVDPSTFVDIQPISFHHGRVIRTGRKAGAFNALQRGHIKRLAKIAKGPRNTETLKAYAAECASFAPVIAACIAGENITDAAIDTAGVRSADDAVSLRVLGQFAPDVIAEAGMEPESQCEEPSNAAERKPAADMRFEVVGKGACARAIALKPVAETAEPMPALVESSRTDPAIVPAALDSVTARLERVEAALGLIEQPKRSPAHAAAIRRAWRMRREMRERADLDRRALLQVNGYNRIMREETDRLSERLNAAESFATSERAELVTEIDRLRSEARRAPQLRASRDRIGRRAATLRRDLARTRAAHAGMAANVQAMTARAVVDAETIERLGGDTSRPRFILNVR